jgi:hypothetical protein
MERYSIHTPHFSIVALVALLVSLPITNTQAQNLIKITKFVPRYPQAAQPIYLQVSLAPQQQAQTVRIRISRLVDLNNDGQILPPGEVRLNETDIQVTDNGKEDIDKRRHFIKVLAVAPTPESLWGRHTTILVAEVALGKQVETAKLLIARTDEAPTTSPFAVLIPKRLTELLIHILARQPAGETNILQLYQIEEKNLVELTREQGKEFFTPQWSYDASQLILVVREAGQQHLAMFDITKRELHAVTDGPTDASPHWTGQKDRVLFIRGSNLSLLSLADGSVRPLAPGLDIERILGVVQTADNSTKVLCLVRTPELYQEFSFLSLEFDSAWEEKSRLQLVDDQTYVSWDAISPDRTHLAVTPKDVMNVADLKDEKKISVPPPESKVMFHDFDPAWSPDGKQLIFVRVVPKSEAP